MEKSIPLVILVLFAGCHLHQMENIYLSKFCTDHFHTFCPLLVFPRRSKSGILKAKWLKKLSIYRWLMKFPSLLDLYQPALVLLAGDLMCRQHYTGSKHRMEEIPKQKRIFVTLSIHWMLRLMMNQNPFSH